jgi:hypothetical protein
MVLTNWIGAIASVVTAAGIFLAWWQIRLAKQQSVTQFEDGLNSQYREIARRLPIEALLGESLGDRATKECLKEFYHYIDLTNEEVFLRRRRRVSRQTWKSWVDGIKWNITRSAFATAWKEIKERSSESFTELRRLEREEFKTDPAEWQDED